MQERDAGLRNDSRPPAHAPGAAGQSSVDARSGDHFFVVAVAWVPPSASQYSVPSLRVAMW